ncbi:sensor histidine kinase [Evansella clarkii]|uniref:sensor histidine kinase n=1 Tax=Evansella clarkii TaxID=79879 RepID=UPI000B445A24|nr:sensor histidine kinase [Evansella clarkii]
MKIWKRYVRERRSWIAAFTVVLLFSNLLFWLDGGLDMSGVSVFYFNLVLAVLFILFFAWRFKRETAYWNELEKMGEEQFSAWAELLPEARSPLEKAVNDVLLQGLEMARESADEMEKRYVLKTSDIEAWVHEMKTPLTAMKLQLEPNLADERFRKIEREWTRLFFLLEQQLYLVRLPSIEHDTVMEKTTVKNLVFPEIKAFSSICRERGIGFDVEGEEMEVTTDVKWGRFIIRQLLSNAIKYSPDGSEILIRAKHDGANHVLEVSDTGSGIEARDLPRVFEKGYTGQAGRKRNASTGLGLYLAKNAADQLKISLSVQSVPGKGTTAAVRFYQPDHFQAPLRSM